MGDNVLSNGGKGSSLLKLKGLGYNVPKFYILNTSEFKQFISYNKLEHIIKQLLQQEKLEEIQKCIINGNFPKTMIDNIYLNFEALETENVSVRSSAVKEDGEFKSFAGQFYTGLNVSKDDLLLEIKKCFASLFNKYMQNYATNLWDNLEMAVVIQKMISSEYAGVAFSKDFSNRSGNFSIIEACKGLGEKVVSGSVTPTKYFIRKELNYVDQIIGEDLHINDKIEEISKIVEKIEKDYNKPMDVEWAISNNIVYILQARPIVGLATIKATYKLILSRPKTLAYMQIEELTEREGIKNILNNLYYLKPIFFYNNNIFEEYYNILDIEENPNCMINYILRSYKDEMIEYTNKALIACKQIENNLKNLSIEELKNLSNQIFPMNNIINFFEARQDEDMFKNNIDNQMFLNEIIKHREYYDDIDYKLDDELEKRIKKRLSEKYVNYYRVMTLDEIFNNEPVSIEELEIREQGFIYFNNQLILKKDMKHFFKDNNMNVIFRDEQIIINSSQIKGAIAYPGKVQGTVKIIYNMDDLSKIHTGDIIVSPMTVPNFTDALKIAGAIVTDEGGTVCHAALIAREMKKTCIVGTKNATKILKDNMIVEVDGDNGIVKIIKE